MNTGSFTPKLQENVSKGGGPLLGAKLKRLELPASMIAPEERFELPTYPATAGPLCPR